MALDTAFYLVTKDICQRAGLLGKRYIAPDGRFILDNKDLSRVRFTTDEYINGLQGVERIDEATAKTLIAEGGYNMIVRDVAAQPQPQVEPEPLQEGEDVGEEEPTVVEEPTEANTDEETPNEETEQGGGEETITGEDVGDVEDVLGDVVETDNGQEQEGEETNKNNEEEE